MHSSSPTRYSPSTPECLRTSFPFKPLNSSPLAESSSPVMAAQARRKSQYKSTSTMRSPASSPRTITPSTPTFATNITTPSTRRVLPGDYSKSIVQEYVARHQSRRAGGGKEMVPPPKMTMREKFKTRCFERAVLAREKTVEGKRSVRDDEFMVGDDESEDEETVMKDELFRRIMEHTNRRHQHSYRVSYEHEVGSSFDPAVLEEWERELTGGGDEDTLTVPSSDDIEEVDEYLQDLMDVT